MNYYPEYTSTSTSNLFSGTGNFLSGSYPRKNTGTGTGTSPQEGSRILICRVAKVVYHPVFEAILYRYDVNRCLDDDKEDKEDKEDKGSIVLDNIQSLNRALFNDIVEYNEEKQMVTFIIKEYNPEIVGILNANSVVTYGQTNRGLPYYLFKPLNKSYPSFIVPFDKKKHGKQDLLAVIKRHTWLVTKRYPIGQVMEYIGEPGVYSNEIEAILIRYDLFRNNVPNKILKEGTEGTEETEGSEGSKGSDVFRDLTDKEVFSIDPSGCEDIDDAMHIERVGEDCFIVGIHIANPALHLPKDGLHDKYVQERLSSIYTPIKRIDMLHPDLAIKKASLIKGLIRPSNSVLFTIRRQGSAVDPKTMAQISTDDYKIEAVNFESVLIKSRENLSYDKAEEIFKYRKPFLSDSIPTLVEITDAIAKQVLPTFKEGDQCKDMHRLVEAWMILVNLYTGRELIKRYDTLAPIRVLGSVQGNTQSSVPPLNRCSLNKELQQFLEIRNNSSAKYVLYEKGNDIHSGLQISQYTHFSSPIRRYFDIIVHRMLFPDSTRYRGKAYKVGNQVNPGNSGRSLTIKNDKDTKETYEKEELTSLLNAINKKNMLIRKAERAFDRIRIVDELQKSGIYDVETMTIIDFSSSSLELYSEKWKTVIKYKIIPKLLRKRWTIDSEGYLYQDTDSVTNTDSVKDTDIKDKGVDTDTGKVIGKSKGKDQKYLIQFHKFDKITIKSYPSAKGSLMELNHELIEPNVIFS
jgi:exoribonuclease R